MRLLTKLEWVNFDREKLQTLNTAWLYSRHGVKHFKNVSTVRLTAGGKCPRFVVFVVIVTFICYLSQILFMFYVHCTNHVQRISFVSFVSAVHNTTTNCTQLSL